MGRLIERVLWILLISCVAYAGLHQVGTLLVQDTAVIGATASQEAPTSSDLILEVQTTTKGALPFPRQTTVQRDNISTPTEGIGVYNTDLNSLNIWDTIWHIIIDGDSAQNLSNKTLASPVVTTAAIYDNQGESRYEEQTGNGSNHVGFKAPDAVTSNFIWKLPDGDGDANQVLETDGFGNLGFVDVVAGADLLVTGLGESGSTLNGSFNIIQFIEVIDSDSAYVAATGFTVPSGH